MVFQKLLKNGGCTQRTKLDPPPIVTGELDGTQEEILDAKIKKFLAVRIVISANLTAWMCLTLIHFTNVSYHSQ